MNRRNFLNALAVASTFLCLPVFNIHFVSSKIPSIFLFIFTDDQRYGDLSLHGNENLETRNLDQLATESGEFVNFHLTLLWTPSRANH